MIRRLSSTAVFAAVLLGWSILAVAGDIDGDGVPDNVDACCNTPANTAVDAVGRPIGDLDADCDVDLADFGLLVINLTGPLAPAPCPNCTDGQHNGDETDLDCGGPLCPSCSDGLMCQVAVDCQSFVCALGHCQTPTCNDGVRNGGETSVDCGGPCPSCTQPNGTFCTASNECDSGFCVDGRCCNNPCGGTCFTCDRPGSPGVCLPIFAGQDPDNECSGPAACDGAGACKSGDGTPCGSPNQCLSGFCVDGRCCDTACTGECRACNLAGVLGDCTFIADGDDPDDECPVFQSCNGAGDCAP